MNTPKKILLIRLSALGDILLATPTARLLAERFPEARIDWLVEAPYVPLLLGNPRVTPLAYDKQGADKGLTGLRMLGQRIAQEGYDLVVDLQNKPKTAFLRSSIQQTIVFRKRTALQGFKSLLGFDEPLVRAHMTLLFAEALAPLDIDLSRDEQKAKLQPELYLTEAMHDEAQVLAPPSSQQLLVGISPGTRWATKCWPVEKFAELARQLNMRGVNLLLIGGPGDRAVFEAIRAVLPQGTLCHDTAALSVGGLVGAIAHCSLVISGDSGPAHIAAALGLATLTLFGPTSPKRWAPRGPRATHLSLELSCSPCSNHGTDHCPTGTHACLRRLEVDQVFEQAEMLLMRWHSTAAANK